MKQDKQRIIVTHVLKNPKVKDKNIWIQLPYLGIIVNKDKELKYVISENLNKICKEKFIKQKILSKDNYKKLIIPFAIDVQKETVYLCPIGYICHGVKRNVCKRGVVNFIEPLVSKNYDYTKLIKFTQKPLSN